MDLESERRRLLERDAQWSALSSKGEDIEGILSFWTDDARVYPPGMPAIIGKPALRSYVEGALAIPGFHITWTSSEAHLSPDGNLGYLLSSNAVTVATHAAGVSHLRKLGDTAGNLPARPEGRPDGPSGGGICPGYTG